MYVQLQRTTSAQFNLSTWILPNLSVVTLINLFQLAWKESFLLELVFLCSYIIILVVIYYWLAPDCILFHPSTLLTSLLQSEDALPLLLHRSLSCQFCRSRLLWWRDTSSPIKRSEQIPVILWAITLLSWINTIESHVLSNILSQHLS